MNDDCSSLDPAAAAQKILELEEKLMFLQQATDELSGVVLAQSAELTQLRRDLESFRKLVEELLDLGVGDDLPHQPPPHY